MGVVINKAKAAEKAQVKKKSIVSKDTAAEGDLSLSDQILQEVGEDALNTVASNLAEIKTLQATIAALSAENVETIEKIETIVLEAVSPTDPKLSIAVGPLVVESAKPAQSRVIGDKEGLCEALEEAQEGLTYDLAQFKMADLDAHLGKANADKFMTKKTGDRKVKVSASE